MRYLVVAHQTANRPELVARLQELRAQDADAEFTVLVPATPIEHLVLVEPGEREEIARRRAGAARRMLEEAGLRVHDISVGPPSPTAAIREEIRKHPSAYAAIVISTFPPAISRWLKGDVKRRIERESGLTVIHVVAAPH